MYGQATNQDGEVVASTYVRSNGLFAMRPGRPRATLAFSRPFHRGRQTAAPKVGCCAHFFQDRNGFRIVFPRCGSVTTSLAGTLLVTWSPRLPSVVPFPFGVLTSMSEPDPSREDLLAEVASLRQALQESEARFRTLADAAPFFIWMTDEQGHVVFDNAPWHRFAGPHARADWAEGVHPDDRERVLTAYREALHRQDAFRLEYRYRVREGGYRWVLDQGVPRHLPDGRFAGLMGTRLDVTDRREGRQRPAAPHDEAEAVACLTSSLLSNLTHEIRTPLTVILGFTSMLTRGPQEEQRRFVQVIERSGRRLLRMLDALVDLAQLEAGTLQVKLAVVNVADVLRGVAEEMRPRAEEKGLVFDVACGEAPVLAELDHEALARALAHLVDNAIKFTDHGFIRLSMDADDRQVYLRVEDTGIGIGASFFPYMFKEFAQESTGLARTHQGTGLGLAVCERLVHLMGGSIQVDSGKGHGSVFTLCLPRQAREQVSA
ncbi:MAG: PAS domain S-box protein [Bacteroidetes bacterium]|nr:MAG: PAS domain S-box protein [Bacteroidota bacterium]